MSLEKEILHKLNTRNPYKIIEWIDLNYPEFKNKCVYNKENKCFNSKDDKVSFYFDPHHSVLEICP